MWQPLASAVYFCIHHSRLRWRTLIASASATATLRRTSCRKNTAPSLFFPPGEKRVRIKVGERRGAAAPEASRRFREGTTEVHLETPNLHTKRLLGYTDDTPPCFSILWTGFGGRGASAAAHNRFIVMHLHSKAVERRNQAAFNCSYIKQVSPILHYLKQSRCKPIIHVAPKPLKKKTTGWAAMRQHYEHYW